MSLIKKVGSVFVYMKDNPRRQVTDIIINKSDKGYEILRQTATYKSVWYNVVKSDFPSYYEMDPVKENNVFSCVDELLNLHNTSTGLIYGRWKDKEILTHELLMRAFDLYALDDSLTFQLYSRSYFVEERVLKGNFQMNKEILRTGNSVLFNL